MPVTLTQPVLDTSRSQRRRLHVAMLDEELPYPPVSGKRIRTLNLTLRLARRHRLTYVCHRNADPAEAVLAREYFKQQGIETVVVERTIPRKSGPGFYVRLGMNLFSSLPYSVASHNSRELRQALVDLAARESVDLWHCEWTPYAEALRCLPGVRKLVMAHNVESLIWQRYYETTSNWLKRWYIGRQWRKFERFEREALGAADNTVAVSADDAALFRDRFGVRNVAVVDNGVDTSFFRPVGEQRRAYQMLFLGSLEWRPNLDAVEQLLTQVFPEVQSRQPAATCVLVGRNPPGWLRQRVAAMSGVSLHGNVPDVRPFLAQSTMLVVPLRIGGGSRLKILEALATGLPVVSTRVGAEGLHLRDGEHLRVGESVEDMANLILDEFSDPFRAYDRAARGREVVLSLYDWDALANRLESIWLDCTQG